MTAEDLQAWLMAQYGAEKFAPGLERVRNFLAPQISALQSARIVTVAGTNGKGETAMSLAALAREQGISYVLWTSPHLLRVTERFQSEAGEIAVDELHRYLLQVESDRQQANIGLSYYEALWAAFLRWGQAKKPQLWILEVGLGGRLDAVNVLSAKVVALTSISRDHQDYLGPSYRAILSEKLGVVHPGKKLISALESRYLRDLTRLRATHFDWIDLFETGELKAEQSFSQRNRFLAEKVWSELGFAPAQVPAVTFTGRGEVWQWQGHEFVFYGSHNPDGLRKLVQFLPASSYNLGKEFFHQIWVAFSERPVGDLRAMKRMLEGLAKDRHAQLCFTRFPHPKAASGEGWWGAGEGSPTMFIHEWNELFPQLKSKANQRVLVTGSYYFVAHLQHHLLSLGATPLRS